MLADKISRMCGLPADPGSYALILRMTVTQRLTVGRLGRGFFIPGIYVYFGSARGPGGLRARLGRHIRGGGKSHWHIDALRAVADIRGYWYISSQDIPASTLPIECLWSLAMAALPESTVPMLNFGASDCRSGCPAHLLALPQAQDLEMKRYSALFADAISVPRHKIICQTAV